MADGVKLDFSKAQPIQSVALDFSKAQPMAGTSPTEVPWYKRNPATMLGATPGSGKIDGISANPAGTKKVYGVLDVKKDPTDLWLESAKNDLNNGTDETGIGKLYKSMGGHGLNVGTSAQDFLPKMAKATYNLFGGAQAAEGIGNLETYIKSITPAARLAHASTLFNEVSQAIGEHPVPMTDTMKDALDQIKEAKDLGSGGGSIAEKVISRLTNNAGPSGATAPLNYKEARTLYSNLGQLTASDKMASNKNMLRLLRNFQSELGNAINSTAEAGSKLPQYQTAMKEFAKGATQQEKLQIIGEWAKKLGIGTAITATAGGAGRAGWDLYQKLFGQ